VAELKSKETRPTPATVPVCSSQVQSLVVMSSMKIPVGWLG
jgi:hypothetical protein